MSENINERAGKALAGRWRDGMRWVQDPTKPIRSEGEEGRIEEGCPPPKYGLPDMADPCTRGGFLDVVREAWGRPRLTTYSRGNRWYVGDWSFADDGGWEHDSVAESGEPDEDGSEAEALVAALEAAPR